MLTAHLQLLAHSTNGRQSTDIRPPAPPYGRGHRPHMRRLAVPDSTVLNAFLLGMDAMDEAMFFLDPLLRYGITAAQQAFWGGYDAENRLLGVMLCGGQSCHVLWQNRAVLPLFADFVRHRYDIIRFTGPTWFAQAFLAQFSAETVRLRQEGTTCVLTSQRLQSIDCRAARRATLADMPHILALEQRVAVHDHSERRDPAARRPTIRQRITAYPTYVAEAAGRVVAVAYTDAAIPQAAHVCEVATDPAYRNHGFATVCVAALCTDLLRWVDRVFLTYADGNSVAARAYDRIGFLPYAKRLRARLVVHTEPAAFTATPAAVPVLPAGQAYHVPR